MKVLATKQLPGGAWARLRDVEVGSLGSRHDEAEALIVVAGDVVDDAVLDRLPSLRLVANYGVGYEGVDVDACRARGIAVTNTPGVLDAATADLTFALILAVRRRLVEGDALVRGGGWTTSWSATSLLGHDLSGATLGIVGLGRIGAAVARRARAFDMRVIFHRRTATGDAEQRDLDDLLQQSDVVSVHTPLTAETRGLISAARLGLLRDGTTFVNTARGPVADEEALVGELVSGRIAAGLDVFTHEPRVPEELLGLPNVVLTPHLGSATEETRAAMTRLVVDNVLALERGEPLLTPV